MTKQIGSLLMAVLLATIWVVGSAPPAAACSCSTGSEKTLVDNYLERGENVLLFRGEQIGQRNKDDRSLWLTFRIDRMYIGSHDGLEVDVQSDTTDWCGSGPQADAGVAAFAAARQEGGDWQLNQCYEPADAAIVDAIFDGLPPPSSDRPSEFIVGHSFGPSNMALLDAQGDITAYGEGDGGVVAANPCPGGEHVVAVVVKPDLDYEDGLDTFAFQVRNAADLAIVSAAETTIERHHIHRPLTELSDVECHNSDGSLVTGLATRVTHNAEAGVYVSGLSQLIVVDRGVLRAFEIGGSRGVTVDAETLTAHVLTADGRRIEQWDLGDGVVVSEWALPDTYAGWNVELADGVFTVLARPVPLDSRPAVFPRVDAALIGPAGELVSYPLGVTGALRDVTATANGTIALLRNPNHLVSMSRTGDVRVDPIEVQDVASFAMGSETTIVTQQWARKPFELVTALGPLTELGHVGAGVVIEALQPVAQFSLAAEPSVELSAQLAADDKAATTAAEARRSDTGEPRWRMLMISVVTFAGLAVLLRITLRTWRRMQPS